MRNEIVEKMKSGLPKTDRVVKKCDCGYGCEPVKSPSSINGNENKKLITKRIETIFINQGNLEQCIEKLYCRLQQVLNNCPTEAGPARDECKSSTTPMVNQLEDLINKQERSVDSIQDMLVRLEI